VTGQALSGEAALEHRRGVQGTKPATSRNKFTMVVPLRKPLRPEENRMHRAQAVKRNSQQEEMSAVTKSCAQIKSGGHGASAIPERTPEVAKCRSAGFSRFKVGKTFGFRP